ncbi:hypothetical protein U3516DRAFT_749223 [Neocallimastix sp. 'constans']
MPRYKSLRKFIYRCVAVKELEGIVNDRKITSIIQKELSFIIRSRVNDRKITSIIQKELPSLISIKNFNNKRKIAGNYIEPIEMIKIVYPAHFSANNNNEHKKLDNMPPKPHPLPSDIINNNIDPSKDCNITMKEAHFRFGVGLTGTNIYTSFHYPGSIRNIKRGIQDSSLNFIIIKCKKNYIELTGILQNVDRIDGVYWRSEQKRDF